MYRVYISGAITADTELEEAENVKKAAEVAYWCASNGMAVYWPHGTWYIDQVVKDRGEEPLGYQWLNGDLEWILCCHSVIVLPGKSRGGELEVKFAEEHGISVFQSDEKGRILNRQNQILSSQLDKPVNTEIAKLCNNLRKEIQVAELEKYPDIPVNWPTTDDNFSQILSELQALHDRKSADYASDEDPLSNLRGSESYGIPAWIGTQLRLDDKRNRIKKAIRSVLKGNKPKMANESLEDSLLDRCVYSIIALQLFRETYHQHSS